MSPMAKKLGLEVQVRAVYMGGTSQTKPYVAAPDTIRVFAVRFSTDTGSAIIAYLGPTE